LEKQGLEPYKFLPKRGPKFMELVLDGIAETSKHKDIILVCRRFTVQSIISY
jgi:hypothetical protein